jgi:hypothetical protein
MTNLAGIGKWSGALFVLTLIAGCTTLGALAQTETPIPTLPLTLTPTPAEPQIGITLQPRPERIVCRSTLTLPANHPLQYEAEATLELQRHTLSFTLETSYLNQVETPLNTVTFYLPLGDRPASFVLSTLSSAPPATSYEAKGRRLQITLADPLPPGCAIKVKLGGRVTLTPIAELTGGNFGYFGYSERQHNLGEWLPVLAPYLNGEWLIPKEWTVGETDVVGSADYRVTFRVNGAPSPQKLEVAGPGEVTRVDATTWRFEVNNARTFAVSVSASYLKDSTITQTDGDQGLIIDLYRYPGGKDYAAPSHALAVARDAASVYQRLFGQPPYRRIAVVQGDFPDGMEFSGLVFVSTKYFNQYEGKPDTWLTLITAHEIAHQWWYASVGSEQGQYPYLDESLAIYSELLYLEQKAPELVEWWWKWRIELYKPSGFVDSTVYEFKQLRPYINAVYLRGAQLWGELRTGLGDEAFFKWLRDYADVGRGKIVTPKTLWGLLTPEQYAKTAAIRAKYFKDSDPLGLSR